MDSEDMRYSTVNKDIQRDKGSRKTSRIQIEVDESILNDDESQ